MPRGAKRADLAAIRSEVARIESEPAFDFSAAPTPAPAPIPEELPPVVGQFDHIGHSNEPAEKPAFANWLLAQQGRKGWIAELAKWAKSDARYPKAGTPDDVRKRLADINAEGDAFEALDDAELDWLAL